MNEHKKRSIAKTVSWRIIASVTTGLIAFFFTQQFLLSVGIGSAEGIIKLIIFYIHERVWNKITWGKM